MADELDIEDTGPPPPTDDDPALDLMGETPPPGDSEYRVLARKYRPQTFDELIGQEAMVRTLSNAFDADRIAHAFILTGVRGVGKTTTARIIAKALNCLAVEGPTIAPCGICSNCARIAASNHMDVLEMDAASRTGIDDIREIIEGVRYLPVEARYKVYIIDEVHMLSRQAFNGLLKTLEEPPPHAKFVFATTEIRKVPVTVLSRCQRFDLRRITADDLTGQFKRIIEAEKVDVSAGAGRLIAQAAEGSMRDGLSLLDQAIAHGGGVADEALVQDMLGLADRSQIFDLLEAVMTGDAAAAIDRLNEMHKIGAEPAMVMSDLLQAVHWVTRIAVVPTSADESGAPEVEIMRGRDLAGKLSLPVLSRAWQVLLKGLKEVEYAARPLAAAEMVLIRLAHMAALPTPGDLVAQLADQAGAATPAPSRGPSGGDGDAQALAAEPQAEMAAPAPATGPQLSGFDDVVTLAGRHRDGALKARLETSVRCLSFARGHLEVWIEAERERKTLPGELSRKLLDWTGDRWLITVGKKPDKPGQTETIAEREDAADAALKASVKEHPLVRAAMETFPGATIADIRKRDRFNFGEAPEPAPDEDDNRRK